jgi:hypothetical protein
MGAARRNLSRAARHVRIASFSSTSSSQRSPADRSTRPSLAPLKVGAASRFWRPHAFAEIRRPALPFLLDAVALGSVRLRPKPGSKPKRLKFAAKRARAQVTRKFAARAAADGSAVHRGDHWLAGEESGGLLMDAVVRRTMDRGRPRLAAWTKSRRRRLPFLARRARRPIV